MLKKFIGGLVFGAGFAVALILVYSIWMAWILPKQLNAFAGRISSSSMESSTTVPEAPPIKEGDRFLGSTNTYSGDFRIASSHPVLAEGAGRIVGRVEDEGRPVAGLRLRLGLNGGVWSQWGTSDAQGRYEIALPLGEYRLDGFEFDKESADRVLPGKIEAPSGNDFGARVTVAKGKPGEGFSFRFVAPVEKLGPRGEVSLKSDVVASWKPYPGAAAYVVQVRESKAPHDFSSSYLFEWRDRPKVREPSVNLTRMKAALKPGCYYTVQITAEDESGRPISETASQFNNFDFKVVN